MGLNMQRPCDVVYNEVYRGKRDLEDAMADYLHDHKDLKLFIFIIPKHDELYYNIKYLSEIIFGVMTQCVSQEKSRQFALMAYVSNLMLKINAKLGGSNFHLEPRCKVGFLKVSASSRSAALSSRHLERPAYPSRSFPAPRRKRP